MAALWTQLYGARADIVLNGHDHIYERYKQQDPSPERDDQRDSRVRGGNGRREPKTELAIPPNEPRGS